ncbi:hypothetical protein ACIGT4_08710 [Streptomyces sioyaensis]|uniref:hypothetical protein n=1 Tax=Streptomyces sioyaensis TaxID=67364 RepID=UPI0037CE5669
MTAPLSLTGPFVSFAVEVAGFDGEGFDADGWLRGSIALPRKSNWGGEKGEGRESGEKGVDFAEFGTADSLIRSERCQVAIPDNDNSQ